MFSYTKLWLSLIALILIFVFGCETDPNRDSVCPVTSILPPPDIESVPETLLVNERTYIIECDLWRDFMPISPPDGKHMNAHIKVIEIDSLEMPANFSAIYLWVFNDDAIWGSSFTNEKVSYGAPYELIRMARCGPKWETDIYVDVVVKLLIGNEDYYLKEEDVYILRTE